MCYNHNEVLRNESNKIVLIRTVAYFYVLIQEKQIFIVVELSMQLSFKCTTQTLKSMHNDPLLTVFVSEFSTLKLSSKARLSSSFLLWFIR